MTRQRVPNENPRKALRLYLLKAGEVGIKSYIDMIISSLRVRAANTSSTLDDIVVVALQVLVDRLFPAVEPDPPSQTEVQEDAPK